MTVSSGHSRTSTTAASSSSSSTLRLPLVNMYRQLEVQANLLLNEALMREKQAAIDAARKQREDEERERRQAERESQEAKRSSWEKQRAEDERRKADDERRKVEQMYEAEQAAQRLKQQRDASRLKDMRRREEDMKQRRLQIEAHAAYQQTVQRQLAADKEHEMAERERRRDDDMERKQAEQAAVNAAKQQQADERIRRVIAANTQQVDSKKRKIEQKMDNITKRMELYEQVKLEYQHEKEEEVRMREEKRYDVIKQAEQRWNERVNNLQVKNKLMAERLEELQQKEQIEAIQREQQRIVLEHKKQQNLERLKLEQDMERQRLLQAIDTQNNKIQKIENKRNKTRIIRQRQAIAVARKKEELLKLFATISHGVNTEAILKLKAAQQVQQQQQTSEDGDNEGSVSGLSGVGMMDPVTMLLDKLKGRAGHLMGDSAAKGKSGGKQERKAHTTVMSR